MDAALAAIAARFRTGGVLLSGEPFGRGLINDSYVLTCAVGTGRRRFLLQRINPDVFSRPAVVVENIERVTTHIAGRLRAQGIRDVVRRVLELVPTHEGSMYCCDAGGAFWRLYHLIEGATSRSAVQTPDHARAAGRAFGEFQRLLADLPGPRLRESIPDFHDTPKRFAALERAVEADTHGRVAAVRQEIDFARQRRACAGQLLDLDRRGEIPERVVHNDAKISNLLFDESTDEALCVVDLDLVMPGLSLYDFGDMVRSMTCEVSEDEVDLSRVQVQMPLFEGLACGYLEAMGDLLTPAERRHLVFAGQLITLEQGVRFLTDYLAGDTYYKTQRPGQNLDRSRNQFRLLESLEQHDAELREIIERL